MVMVSFNGMKNVLVPIGKAGRVVLPKEVRDELAINPGDLFSITIHGNQVTLSPNKEVCGFIRRGKALVFSSGEVDLLDTETVENVRNATRSESLSSVSKGLPSQKRK